MGVSSPEEGKSYTSGSVVGCDCARAGAGFAPEDPGGLSSSLRFRIEVLEDREIRGELGTVFPWEAILAGGAWVALGFERGWPLTVP